MNKFKVGDRVKLDGVHMGTVLDVSKSPGNVVVEMDDPALGIEVSQFPGRKVWWLSEDRFTKVRAARKIIITHDGTTTIARMFEGNKAIKTAEAKCAPSDTFDFSIGTKLAFDRLMGRVEKHASQDTAEERRALADKICKMGMCSANNSARKNSCPFYKVEKGALCCTEYAAAHPETQKMMEDYLAAEQEVKPERPAEKQEPIKLYCVKDFASGIFLTRGKVYEFVPGKGITYDDGRCGGDSYGGDLTQYTRGNPSLSDCLVPLVSRPAKVGEWVYIVDDGFWPNHDLLHKLAKCVGLSGGDSTLRFDYGDRRYASPRRYLVLDGYQPEPECYNAGKCKWYEVKEEVQ